LGLFLGATSVKSECYQWQMKLALYTHGGRLLTEVKPGQPLVLKGLLWKYLNYPRLPKVQVISHPGLRVHSVHMNFHENNYEAIAMEIEGFIGEMSPLENLKISIDGCLMIFQFPQVKWNSIILPQKYLWANHHVESERFFFLQQAVLNILKFLALISLIILFGRLGKLFFIQYALGEKQTKMRIKALARLNRPYIFLHQKIWDYEEKELGPREYLQYY
jgi:hypothetical protein